LASTGLATSPAALAANSGALGGAGPASGTIFVADPGVVSGGFATGPGSVSLYRPGSFGNARPEVVVTKGIDGPGGIAVDSSGNLWVANESGNVVEYSRAELAKASPAPTVTISPGGDGLAFDPSGNLWVSTGSSVVEYSKAELAKSGSPTPVFTLNEDDCSVGFDSSGDLWEGSTSTTLTEWTKSQLANPGKSGEFLLPKVTITSDSLNGPCKPAFAQNGDVWAGNYNTNLVVEFTKAQLGKTATLAPKVVISSKQNGNPGDVAFDASGDLWVPTEGLHSVVEYTKAQLAKSGSPVPHVTISTPASPNGPWAVAIEP
jgi:streptogramin lyase